MFKSTGEILERMVNYGYPLEEPKTKGPKNYINSSRYKGTPAPIKILERFREVYKEVKLEK